MSPCRGPRGPSSYWRVGTPRLGTPVSVPVWVAGPPTTPVRFVPPSIPIRSAGVIAASNRAARVSGGRLVSHHGRTVGSPHRPSARAHGADQRPINATAARTTRQSSDAEALARPAPRLRAACCSMLRWTAPRGTGTASPWTRWPRLPGSALHRYRSAYCGGSRRDVLTSLLDGGDQ